jgi:hypothetical protein
MAAMALRWVSSPIRSWRSVREDALMADRSHLDRKRSGTLRRLLTWLRGPMHPFATDEARDRTSLIVCRACRSQVANPVDWQAVDESRWWIRLRCGECASSRDVVVGDDAAELLERDLEPGLREIAAAIARLDRERMTREVDAFIAELENGLIRADDFGRRKP